MSSYRTVGEASNRMQLISKSIRPFKWITPCNKVRPATIVFDSRSGIIGRIECTSFMENIFFCQRIRYNIFDHNNRLKFYFEFAACNIISYFGLWPWEPFNKVEIKVIND
jgi:hypothetical protein